jgi:hypothetical protein
MKMTGGRPLGGLPLRVLCKNHQKAAIDGRETIVDHTS